ncbi:MAG TPA: hypothetical protein VEB21_05615 [Terriglobales bacterium]|nr:hypothetical protein [Terriglobales bacterium]
MKHRPTWLALWLFLVPFCAVAQETRQLSTAAGGTVAYSRDPNTVILSLQEDPGEVRSEDTPSVRVFGDGRALIHYPAHMKQAGDYELRLTEAELDELMRTVAESKVPEIDTTRVRERKRTVLAERRARREVVHETSDATVSTVEIDLARYQPTASAPRRAATRVKRSLRWSGVEPDAEQLPEIAELQGLNQVRGKLRAIMERPDRRKLR